MEQQKQIL
jgi:hypothetical protein